MVSFPQVSQPETWEEVQSILFWRLFDSRIKADKQATWYVDDPVYKAVCVGGAPSKQKD